MNPAHQFTTAYLSTRFYQALNPCTKKEVQNAHNRCFLDLTGDVAWQALDDLARQNREMGADSRSTYSDSSMSLELKSSLAKIDTLSHDMAAMKAEKVALVHHTPDAFYSEEQANLILQHEANWVQFPRKQDGPHWPNPNHSKYPGFNYADPTGCANPAPVNHPPQHPPYPNNQARQHFQSNGPYVHPNAPDRKSVV